MSHQNHAAWKTGNSSPIFRQHTDETLIQNIISRRVYDDNNHQLQPSWYNSQFCFGFFLVGIMFIFHRNTLWTFAGKIIKLAQKEHECTSIFRPVAGVPHRCRAWSPLKSAFVSERGRHRQLRDRRWQICLTTNVHLSAYWRALSQQWFMPKFPTHAKTSITSSAPRSSTLPFLPCSAVHVETKSGPVISRFHAVRFARSNAGFIFRKSLRVSSILIDSAVTFPMEDYTVYLWMILFTSVRTSFVLT